MKQVVEVKVTFEMDYSNPDLAPYLEEKLKQISMDQIKVEMHELLASGIKELVDEDMKGDGLPGLTYYVEDISA